MKYIIIFILLFSLSPCIAEYEYTATTAVTDKITLTDTQGAAQYYQYGALGLGGSKTLFMYCKFRLDSVYSGSSIYGHILLNTYGYQSYTYQRLAISSVAGTHGAEGHFMTTIDTQDSALQSYESDNKITLGDGKSHDFAIAFELHQASSNVKCTMYMDNYTPEVFYHTLTSSTYNVLCRNNITFLNLFQGVQSCNFSGAMKEWVILGSSNEDGIKNHDSLYRMLRAGHGSQVPFLTLATPIADQNVWGGSTPEFSFGGLSAETQYKRRKVTSNSSWTNIIPPYSSTTPLTFNNFTSPTTQRTNPYKPDFIRAYEGKTITYNAHDTYFNNGQKRRR